MDLSALGIMLSINIDLVRCALNIARGMLLSHSKRFIFIKTVKTAGTSVEILLSSYLGADDVLTPIGGQDEERVASGCGPRNYKGWFNPIPLLWQGPLWRRRKTFTKFSTRRKFYQHMAGYEIKGRVPREVWDNYFKFCVVRNPWDKVVSAYYYDKKLGMIEPDSTFRDFVHSHRFKSDWFIYTINDEVIVDRVLRFENLADELAEISKSIGVNCEAQLPLCNSQSRPANASYQDLYDDELRDIIADRYRNEIDAFGYTF